MSPSKFEEMLPIFAIGFLIMALGVASRLGFFKHLYITKGIPGIYARNSIYGAIPLGLAFMILGVDHAFENLEFFGQSLFSWMFYGCMVLALGFLIWQPRWLKPAWLCWLEFHYGHVLDEMLKEAREMGTRTWGGRVRTQEDLEQWANSVAEKYGWTKRIG
jgi:hypothetical protein